MPVAFEYERLERPIKSVACLNSEGAEVATLQGRVFTRGTGRYGLAPHAQNDPHRTACLLFGKTEIIARYRSRAGHRSGILIKSERKGARYALHVLQPQGTISLLRLSAPQVLVEEPDDQLPRSHCAGLQVEAVGAPLDDHELVLDADLL